MAELRRLEEYPDHLLIGAARPYAGCTDALRAFPGVPELLERLGSLQIRQRGSLGGNIANASPIGDMPPVLLALDARLRLRRTGQVREVPIDGFFTGYRQSVLQPGEYIEAIVIPRLREGQLFRVDKVSKRRDDDISAVCLALRLDFDERGLVKGLSPMDELDAVVAAVNVPVQAVGGLTIPQAIDCPAHGAPLVVLGAPLVIDANEFKTSSNDLHTVLREISTEIRKTPLKRWSADGTRLAPEVK